MEKTASLTKPSSTYKYIVIWRSYGIYLVQAFDDHDKAMDIYHELIKRAITTHMVDTSFEAYLVYYLGGYNDNDK